MRVLSCFVALLICSACSAGNEDVGGSGTATSGTGASSAGGSAHGGSTATFGEGGQGGEPVVEPIVVTPSDFALSVVEGSIEVQTLTATRAGEDVTDQVEWSIDRPLMGDIVDSTFTPSGSAGGVGTITATLGASVGSATARVKVTKTFNTGGLTAGQMNQLDFPSGGGDPAMQVLYPYDQTVFPLDVLGPEIQWNGTAAGDVYKLTIFEKYYEYTEYFAAAPPASHAIAADQWTAVTESGTGGQTDPVAVKLTRLSSGVAYQPTTRTWHVAPGRLKGAVYYWELPTSPPIAPCDDTEGKILKLKLTETSTEQFYQPGRCWGCHTVSRDGRKMMAGYGDTFPDPLFTLDLTQSPVEESSITESTGLIGTFGAFNKEGDRILVSDDGGNNGDNLHIIDADTGAVLNDSVLGPGCAEPAWSPDGTKIAAICGTENSNQNWAFDSSTGNLLVAGIDTDGFTDLTPHVVVTQFGEQGRPAYPSFAPGSEYIAFGRPTIGSRSTGDGNLWLTDIAGDDVKVLTTMSSDNKSFNPVFAPVRAGGYFWVVFISRRDYGNKMVGTNRQQLWIGAITDPPTASDPSHPPFYLRGQEQCGKSENAYFALEPCKSQGDACTSGIDCCSGTCVKQGESYVCGTPGDCAADGNACDTSDDCCNAPISECVDGFCTPPPPQ